MPVGVSRRTGRVAGRVEASSSKICTVSAASREGTCSMRRGIAANISRRIAVNRQRLEEQRLREERERELLQKLNQQQKEQQHQ
jgi:hypothetical protein